MIDIKFTIRTLNNTSTENLVGSTERSKREVGNGSNFELFRFFEDCRTQQFSSAALLFVRAVGDFDGMLVHIKYSFFVLAKTLLISQFPKASKA